MQEAGAEVDEPRIRVVDAAWADQCSSRWVEEDLAVALAEVLVEDGADSAEECRAVAVPAAVGNVEMKHFLCQKVSLHLRSFVINNDAYRFTYPTLLHLFLNLKTQSHFYECNQ